MENENCFIRRRKEIKKLKVKNKELQNNELIDFNLVNNKSNLRYSHI